MLLQLTPYTLLLSAIALLVILLGIGALGLAVFRRRLRDRALVMFGLFSLLYGIRVSAGLPFAPALFAPLGGVAEWGAMLTYVLPLPLILFVQQFVGAGWRGSMRAVLWMQAIYTAFAMAADLLSRRPGAALAIKPYIIVIVGAVALANVIEAGRRTDAEAAPPLLIAGLAAFLLSVGGWNLSQIIHHPFSSRIELAGFLALVGCLAAVVARRAVDTATRLHAIEQELTMARRIQTAVLPQSTPVLRGVKICARYRPLAAVDGDFYDFMPAGDAALGVLIADVSGHGVPAALIAAMVKVALAAQAPHASDPGAVLKGINDALCGLLTRDYVTGGYLVIDLEASEIRYAGAGHPQPLVRAAGGAVEELTTGGTILGQFAGSRYDEVVRRLDAPARVLLYTDGVIEAADPAGEFFGVDRLRSFLVEHGGEPPDAFADALLATLTAWRGGGSFEDDVTVVIVDLAPTLAPAA